MLLFNFTHYFVHCSQCLAHQWISTVNSRFLDYDVNMSTTLSRVISLPSRWYALWSHHDFDVNSFSMGSNDMFVGAAHIAEYKTQPNSINSKSESSVVEQQQPTVMSDSCVATFTVGDEPAEIDNVVAVSSSCSPTSTSESAQQSTLQLGRQDQRLLMLNLRHLVPVQAHHSRILSAIRTFDHQPLLSVRSGSDVNLDRKQCRQDKNDVQSSLISSAPQYADQQPSQQHHKTIDSRQQPSFLGLPRRINVSKRELNMMSPLSFWVFNLPVGCMTLLHY